LYDDVCVRFVINIREV